MILNRIVIHKRKEVARQKKHTSLDLLKKLTGFLPKKKSLFLKALKKARGIAVIAEIKRKSPSKGILRKDFDAVRIAKDYAAGGATALSVLTDETFFGGSATILKKVRRNVTLPILRKDFILDEYQIYQSRLIGADAILLIASILSVSQLKKFRLLAEKLGLECLFEVHTELELKKIMPLKPKLIGINNRDLKTFRVDIRTTERLAKKVPSSALLVSESGIQTPSDIKFVKSSGAKAVLVGESLIRQKDIRKALKKLLSP